MLVKKIVLSEDEMDYTQFCNYCLEGYKMILNHILLEKSEYGYEYSKENYKFFMDEYQQAYFKFFMNTQELLKKYAPEFMRSQHHNVIYDFEKRTMNIYDGDEHDNE